MTVMMDLENLLEHPGCAKCAAGDLFERMVTEKVPFNESGEFFEVEVPVLECSSCGFSYTDHRAEALRHAAACQHQGLLTPEEIKAIRRDLRMSRREFSEAFGIPPASLERWENGRLIQNTSLDTLLRALQNPTTAARLDRRLPADRANGQVLTGRFPVLGHNVAELENARKRGNGFRLRAFG